MQPLSCPVGLYRVLELILKLLKPLVGPGGGQMYLVVRGVEKCLLTILQLL